MTESVGRLRDDMLTIAEVYDRGLIDGVVTGDIYDYLIHPNYSKRQVERVFQSSVQVELAGCTYQVRRSELKPQKQLWLRAL